MKAIIFIDTREAVLAGVNNAGEYTIEFDPADLSQPQRDELAESSFRKSQVFIAYKGIGLSDEFTGGVQPNIDTLRNTLDARIAARKEKAAEEAEKKAKEAEINSKKIQEWSDSSPENRIEYVTKEWSRYEGRYWRIKWPFTEYPYDRESETRKAAETNPIILEAIEDAESLAFWKNLEEEIDDMREKRLSEEKERLEKAEAEAKKQRTVEQIAAWVAAHGTEDQKARLADNFLAEYEIEYNIRQQAYADLDKFPRYKKLKSKDVCTCDYEYGDINFRVKEADSLTASDYATLQAIKSAAPKDAQIETRIHIGKCEDCESTAARIGFMVRITVGEFSFSREYGTGNDDQE
jgi:hypothetical protein